MNIFAIIFLLVNAAALLIVPRRWASLPLLVGTCYMTLNQGFEVGPFHFPIIRLLITSGLIRVIVRRERLIGGVNGLDRLIVIWSVWALVSSFFHEDPSQALIFRLGLIFNACGTYFLFRIFCQSIDDIKLLYYLTAILLLPVAVEMLYEQLNINNLFHLLGGDISSPTIRLGRVRASGPFSSAILAGSIGAACLPFMIALWEKYRILAISGTMACSIMIISSASSGPIMSAMSAMMALFMWRYRHHMRLLRWLAVFLYISLDIFMKAPAYYIMGHIDLTGGSTGWHRAALIEHAISHLHEWWVAGTDYTRHWMPTGISWSPEQTDITNHYLQMGVLGGLPLLFLFIAILAKGFFFVGKTLRQVVEMPRENLFAIWTLGASLFVHVVTFISVSYFDQSFLFIYLTLAAIGSAYSCTLNNKTKDTQGYIHQYNGKDIVLGNDITIRSF